MISKDKIEACIRIVWGQRIILDSDLAKLYGVSTKRLNEQIKRNRKRFPPDFLFRLSQKESEEVLCSRSQFATLKRGMNIKYRPYALSEYGAFMAANVLNSKRAVVMSVYVIRVFVRLREAMHFNQRLEKRFAIIEKSLLDHDQALRDLLIHIKPLLLPSPEKPRRRIGFHSLV